MRTIEEVLKYKSKCMDGRDVGRFLQFLPVDKVSELGFTSSGVHDQKEYTEENVLAQLKVDVAFGFEKSLGKRGSSAGLMYNVVSFWNWVLENELEGFDIYAPYGIPLFRNTALLYNFPNPIGDDTGSELHYSEDYDEEDY